MDDPYLAPAARLAVDPPVRRRSLWALILAVPCFCFGALLLLGTVGQLVLHGHRYWVMLLGGTSIRRSDWTGLMEIVGFGLCGLIACTSGQLFWTNRLASAFVTLLTGLLLLALTIWTSEVGASF